MARFLHPRFSFAAVLLAMLLSTCAFCANASKHPSHHQDAKTIQAMELAWHDGLLKGDVALISPMMADDFLGVSANGMLSDKQQYLGRVGSGRYKFTRIEPDEEPKIRLKNDIAIVVSRAFVEAQLEEAKLSGIYRYTRVYRRTAGQWKVINFEATRVNGSAGATDMQGGVPLKPKP